MGERIEFTRNYNDLCTRKGFQFEFFCDRCGSGYRTKFKPSATGTVSEVLEAASSIFGGLFGRAADVTNRVQNVSWEKAHDEAFREAMEELKPSFIQCPRCSAWVCRKACWNNKKGLCKGCAPDLGVEMAAAQASRSVEEVWAHARMADEDRKLSEENWKDTIVATCPKCEVPLQTNAKFCPECGENLKKSNYCQECGATLSAGAKFCPECGTKVV